MFHINQSGAICSEFEARLCKFMVIPLATLQRGVSIREGPGGGKERIGGRTKRKGVKPDSESRKEQGKSERRKSEREREGRGEKDRVVARKRERTRATSAYFMNP